MAIVFATLAVIVVLIGGVGTVVPGLPGAVFVFAGLVGLVFGVVGLLIGPFVGAVAGEFVSRRDLTQSARAGAGAWLGFVLGTAVKLALVLSMVGITAATFLLR